MDSKWTSRFISLAKEVAGWSRDPATRVGAVIIRPDKSIASVGFNGFARKVADIPSRLEDRSQKLLFTLHAELNAILSAKEPLVGYSIFVWPIQPCAQCAAAIIQSGITEVTYPRDAHAWGDARWAESFYAASQMFDEAGVAVNCV